MANTEDLRYVRTEASIRSSFMELVASESVASVSVSALCRHAGISRNAFYLHYTGIMALYSTLVEELVENVRNRCIASSLQVAATGASDENFSSSILQALGEHEGLLRALLPSDDGSAAKCLADGLTQVYEETGRLISNGGNEPTVLEHRLACSYCAWAHVGIISRWIAETTRPLSEALPYFERFQSELIQRSVQLLMQA